jgi:hypothetical protein
MLDDDLDDRWEKFQNDIRISGWLI